MGSIEISRHETKMTAVKGFVAAMDRIPDSTVTRESFPKDSGFYLNLDPVINPSGLGLVLDREFPGSGRLDKYFIKTGERVFSAWERGSVEYYSFLQIEAAMTNLFTQLDGNDVEVDCARARRRETSDECRFLGAQWR